MAFRCGTLQGVGIISWMLMPGPEAHCQESSYTSKTAPLWIVTVHITYLLPLVQHGSTWSLGSETCLPLGGHISCTCSETPTRTRDRSSSSSLCIHHSEQLGSDSEGQESEGSSSHQGGEADTTMSESSDESSCEESSSEAESIESQAHAPL